MTNESQAPALLPCPFCESAVTTDGKSETLRVRCLDCGVQGPIFEFNPDDDKDIENAQIEAIESWNHRPSPGEVKPSAGLDLEACERFMLGPWSHPEPNLRPTALALIAEVRRLRSLPLVPAPLTCEWRLTDSDNGVWSTACDNEFAIIEGGPKDNGFKFCCMCGKPIPPPEQIKGKAAP
jgi:hypothetical protein